MLALRAFSSVEDGSQKLLGIGYSRNVGSPSDPYLYLLEGNDRVLTGTHIPPWEGGTTIMNLDLWTPFSVKEIHTALVVALGLLFALLFGRGTARSPL
jgi:hypothetical protein